MSIRVSIIEDDRAYRDALATILRGTRGFACSTLYANAEDALAHLEQKPADVTLVDILLPGLSGIEFVRQFKRRYPETLVLMLTLVEDTQKIFESLRAGADGYILKSTPPAGIIDAISELKEGGSPMSRPIARTVLRYFHDLGQPSKSLTSLTEREDEVLRQLATGKALKQIAADLSVTVETVHAHLRKIYQKLQVHSRAEAVVKYQRDR